MTSDPEFLRDAIAGLTSAPKSLPGKYLWDEAGSDLFDRICGSTDYYPTRCEMALLPGVAAAVADRAGPGVTVVEFGSGASRKIRTLLDALPSPAGYIALDIAGDYLKTAIDRLRPDYPGVAMTAICADYSKPIRLPKGRPGSATLGFFPGTSIGNFSPAEAGAFLARARETLGPSYFLVGVDATVDAARLDRVYGGCDGLMAAFHLNILSRLNCELGATFDLGNFEHRVDVARDPLRVEARLAARKADAYRLSDRTISVAAGEYIRTDVSHKYDPDAFRALATQNGWQPVETWLDPERSFSLHLLRN